MKKVSKLLVAIMVVMSTMAISVSPVFAADGSEEGMIVDGSYLLHETESEHVVYSPLRGYYISNGSGKITMPMAGRVGASGNTFAYVKVPSIKVTVTVQRYVDKSWVGVTSWTAENKNAYSVTTSKTINVPSKYYYRVKTIHTAGGELLSGYTNGIWVI